LSQTDWNFDKPKYVKDNPELQEACSADIQQISADLKKQTGILQQTTATKASLGKNRKLIKELLDQIEDIINPTNPGQKRRRRCNETQIGEFFCDCLEHI
jgi:hypothetical protein